MPLSALMSEGEGGVSPGCVDGMPSLRRALRVLIRECSKPCPRDHVWSLPREVECNDPKPNFLLGITNYH
jgi:hypothetical protein